MNPSKNSLMSQSPSLETRSTGAYKTEAPRPSTPIQARLRRILERLSRRNFHFAKTYGILGFYLSHLQAKDPLVVYQMGKVGSTTILTSLEALELDHTIYHAHFLTWEGIKWAEGEYKKNFHSRHSIARHYFDSWYLRKRIDRGFKGQRWKVITLTREPIGRNISSFFQILDHQFSDYGYKDKVRHMNAEELVEELVELFAARFEHDMPLTWFDSELKAVFGVDVFATNFPKQKGYKIYPGEHADVLLLRLEDLNECAPEAFKAFLDIEAFVLTKANVARDKDYYATYRKLLDSITLPDAYIERMYASRYARHFYSAEEIAAFSARWQRGTMA